MPRICRSKAASSIEVIPLALGVPVDFVEPVVLTRADLERPQDPQPVIRFAVPLASSALPGDTLVILVGANVLYSVVFWPIDNQGRYGLRPNDVGIPAERLLSLGTGLWDLQYQLVRRGGWRSTPSRPRRVELRLAPGVVLLAPIVTVDRVDRVIARNGLLIQVPDLASAQPSDRIVMRLIRPGAFAGDTDRVVVLAEFAYADVPRAIAARWQDLAVAEGFGQSFYKLNIDYTLHRGALTLGTSLRTQVPVDLRTVGPIPDDEGPVNPRLTAVIVRGRGSAVDNVLTERDVDADADITFTFYERLAAGHFVRFFYDGVELLAAQVRTLTGAETPGSAVIVTLPRAIFLAQGNGPKHIFYEVYPDDTAQSAGNYQRSPATTVAVDAVRAPFVRYSAIRNDLLQNQRPGATRTGILNCLSAPWSGINLQIVDSQLAEHDRVTIIFQYSTGGLGTALVDQHYSADHLVTAVEAVNGSFAHRVPYEQILFYNRAQQPTPPVPLLTGSFVSSFTVTKPSGDLRRSEPCLVRYFRDGVCGPVP